MIQKQQEEDERLRAIKQVLEKEPCEDYVVENGLLMKKVADKVVVALPSCIHLDIIQKAHENGTLWCQEDNRKHQWRFLHP